MFHLAPYNPVDWPSRLRYTFRMNAIHTPRPPSEVLRERIRQAREARKLSQRELAESVSALGVRMHQPGIARIEEGTRSVKVDELVAIAIALDRPPEALYQEVPWKDLQVARAEQETADLPLRPDEVWFQIWRHRLATQKEDE